MSYALSCRECFLRDNDPEAALEAFQAAQGENAALKDGAIEAFIAAAGSEDASAPLALSPHQSTAHIASMSGRILRYSGVQVWISRAWKNTQWRAALTC